MSNSFHNLFKIQVDLPIYKNKSFYFYIFLLPIISFLFSIPLIRLEVNGFCWSSECYSTFVDVFKFPLWLSSGSFIIGAIYIKFYNSILSSEKLGIDKREEVYKRYYDHLDRVQYLGDHYIQNNSQLSISSEEIIFDSYSFYRLFYKDNSPSKSFSFYPSIDAIQSVFKQIDLLVYFSKNTLDCYYEKSLDTNINKGDRLSSIKHFNDNLMGFNSFIFKTCFLKINYNYNKQYSAFEFEYLPSVAVDFLSEMLRRLDIKRDDGKFYEINITLRKTMSTYFNKRNELLKLKQELI